jgi:sensor histidine kinase regulating citrate/malate metabolism
MDNWEVIAWVDNAIKKQIQRLEKEINENKGNDTLLIMNNNAIRNYNKALRIIEEKLK